MTGRRATGSTCIGEDDFVIPKLSAVVAALDDPGHRGFWLSDQRVLMAELHQRLSNALNDHTHGGTHALARLALSNAAGGPAVADDEPALLPLTSHFAMLAARILLEDTGRRPSTQVLIELCERLKASVIRFDQART